MPKKLSSIFLVFFFSLTIFGLTKLLTRTVKAQENTGLSKTIKDGGLSDIGKVVYGDENPKNVMLIIADIIKLLLSFLGIIFLSLIIYGGFLWMTAGGTPDKIVKAKAIIINGVIGMAIILSSYAITSFVLDSIIKVTANP